MGLADKLKDVKVKSGPVWKGPEEDGITFSLLSRFLVCRERFRLLVVEGLRPADHFNHKLEYGNMWHLCEEVNEGRGAREGNKDWERALQVYSRELCKRYPTDQEQIDKWYNVCKVQFPIYLDYWSKHKESVERVLILREQVFCVPYALPSGRVVKLRGKWDGVDLVESGANKGLWNLEHKSKGDIDEARLQRQLTFDLQTMMYLTALHEVKNTIGPPLSKHVPDLSRPIRGVIYNAVRRPLSGGRGTIVQHKPTKKNPAGESKAAYYDRLRGIIDGSAGEDAPGPSYFFMRWKVTVTPEEVLRFRQTCLDPILEQLCDWWEWIAPLGRPIDPDGSRWGMRHWRHPFGVYNVLDEGGSSDLDEYLREGNLAGLTRTDNLFPELS